MRSGLPTALTRRNASRGKNNRSGGGDVIVENRCEELGGTLREIANRRSRWLGPSSILGRDFDRRPWRFGRRRLPLHGLPRDCQQQHHRESAARHGDNVAPEVMNAARSNVRVGLLFRGN